MTQRYDLLAKSLINITAEAWIKQVRCVFALELDELKDEAPELYEQVQKILVKHPMREAGREGLIRLKYEEDFTVLRQCVLPLDVKAFQKSYPKLAERFSDHFSSSVLRTDLEFFKKKRTRIASREERKRNFETFLEASLLKRQTQACHQTRFATRQETLSALLKRLKLWEKTKSLLEVLCLNGQRTVGRGYDFSGALFHETDFALLREFAELADSEGIKRLLEELGRLAESELEHEEAIIEDVEFREMKRTVTYVSEEVVGITTGADLQRALASELGLLSANREGEEGRGGIDPEIDELLELLLFSKMTERALMQYELVGFERDWTQDHRIRLGQRPKPKKSGPFIICVDTSGSMSGQPERVAKTLAFVLLRCALEQSRKCYLISFSSVIQVFDLSELQNSLTSLLKFLKMSFHGGTDVTPALTHALQQLKHKDYKRADVVVVSDFVMPSLAKGVLTQIHGQKQTGTRFHSVVIGGGDHGSALEIFDTEWRFQNDWSSLIKSTLLSQRSKYN